jgi:hypothetical protein
MDELGPACGGVVGDRPVGMADRRGTEIEEHQEEGEVAGAETEDQRDPARDLDGRRQHRPDMHRTGQARHEMSEQCQVPPVIDPRHQIKRSDADPAQQQDQRLATQNQGIDNPQRHDAHPNLLLVLPFSARKTAVDERNHNATAQAAEGNLGGFRLDNSGIEISRRPSWPSAYALTRTACCGRLRSASCVAQPSSSAVRAVFFAMLSWTIYGDAAERIKPRCAHLLKL